MNVLFAICLDVQVGEFSASGFVVGLQQFGYDAALCWYGILHSKHGNMVTNTVTCIPLHYSDYAESSRNSFVAALRQHHSVALLLVHFDKSQR